MHFLFLFAYLHICAFVWLCFCAFGAFGSFGAFDAFGVFGAFGAFVHAKSFCRKKNREFITVLITSSTLLLI